MGYRKAEICLKRHITTEDLEHSGELASPYCPKCGAETIRECPSCEESIRGYYISQGAYSPYEIPAYCHSCGKAYPWTQTALNSARELVEELDELNREEKDKLNGSIEELIQDSPKAQVAAVRFKKLMKKVGQSGADAIHGILVNVVTEAIKNLIF